MGTGINGVVLTLGAVSGLREAINTYTPMNLSYEAFRANAEMYMQKISGCHGIGHDGGRGPHGAGDHFGIIVKGYKEAKERRK